MEDNKNIKFVPRSVLIANCKIDLTETDPLKRLKEFCRQGRYIHKMTWDKFSNGFMIECEIMYNIKNNRRRTLIKEVRYITTDDLQYAKKVISAITIERLGLSPLDMEEDNEENNVDEKTEDSLENLKNTSIKMASSLFGSLSNKDSSNKPLFTFADNLIKQMAEGMTEDSKEEDKSENMTWDDVYTGDSKKSWADIVGC